MAYLLVITGTYLELLVHDKLALLMGVLCHAHANHTAHVLVGGDIGAKSVGGMRIKSDLIVVIALCEEGIRSSLFNIDSRMHLVALIIHPPRTVVFIC